MKWIRDFLVVLGYLLVATAVVPAYGEEPTHPPLYLVPTIDGLSFCDAGAANESLSGVDAIYDYCNANGLDASDALIELLDTLEPGGPSGRVQVGYLITVQLLTMFHEVDGEWEINPAQADTVLRIIKKVDRPVVVYLAANQFDSTGPIVEHLHEDARNFMHLSDGSVPVVGYFGYPIVPYTLLTDPDIPVNRYRFQALDYMIARIADLPDEARERIVGYTLAGELHQMFPDFEHGMGLDQPARVTDYSKPSVLAFRSWLRDRYGEIAAFNREHQFDYASFDEVPAPGADIRKERLNAFAEHYDAFAAGSLPFSGWLWDPQEQVEQLDLYVDGERVDSVVRGLNRLDVYRAVDEITTPNTGFRYDLDYREIQPGRHLAQIVAVSEGKRYELGQREFVVMTRDQAQVDDRTPKGLGRIKNIKKLTGVRSWLDSPRGLQDVYYNPLARDWDAYRQQQVYDFLKMFHARAVRAGLPADKLYSQQIIPQINSSWNVGLFASDSTISGDTPWRQGLNLYGGAADSDWLRGYLDERGVREFGSPEFNPQQWKIPGTHLAALKAQQAGGARFISPFYFSLVHDRFKGAADHSVNRMEIRPDNSLDGADQFYRAIVEFARN